METNLIKQEFIIKSLQPYFEDRHNCGYDTDFGGCVYETTTGKKCVVGQYLNTDIYKESTDLFKDIASGVSDFNEILVDEAKHILSIDDWALMQRIHDDLAQCDYVDIFGYITELETISDINLYELRELLKLTKVKYDDHSE